MRYIFIALLLVCLASSARAEDKQGDVNKDGKVTIADVTKPVDIILGKEGGTETGEFDDDPATGPANAPKRK